MPGEKRSKVEVELIVNQICTMLIKGITRNPQILEYIGRMDALPEKEQKKRNWIPVKKEISMVNEYIRRAREMLVESVQEEREKKRARFVAQLEDLYQQCVSQGKYHTANQVMKNKMYLEGMGGVNILGKFNIRTFDVQLTDEEQAAYKERLKDMYGDE